MAISYYQKTKIKGPIEALRKAFPFIHPKAFDGFYFELDGVHDYTTPFGWHELSLKYPELCFMDSFYCDTNFHEKIRVTKNGKSAIIYDQEWFAPDNYHDIDHYKKEIYTKNWSEEELYKIDENKLNVAPIPITENTEIGFVNEE